MMAVVQKRKIQWAIYLFLVMLYFSGLPTQAKYGGGPVEPSFAVYYEPWEFEIEPNIVSYELPLDPNRITNYGSMSGKLNLGSVKDLICQNGFVVIEHEFGYLNPGRVDIVQPYVYMFDRGISMFVTSDTLLHLYHILFDENLKDIEERQFYSDIVMLTDMLLNDTLQLYDQLEGDLKEAARRNVAYLSVASQLIGSSSPVPQIVSSEVSSELARIEAHSGFGRSTIFIYEEDYSQYVPRGHYPRSETLKKYFKTLMWYGRMAFLLKGGPGGLISEDDARIQTLQACLLAISLNDSSAREIWDRIYRVTAFYVGLADDLTPYDYLWALDRVFGQEYVLADLEDPNNLLALKTELALLPSPRIFGGTGNAGVVLPVTEETLNEILDNTKGMRLMGRRFIPDSYMFQNLVFPKVGSYIGDLNDLPFTVAISNSGLVRGYPRGLDVMALLGSEQARDILIQEGDTDYEDYWDRFNELAEEFGPLSPEEWNRNLYWGWLYSLRALITGYGDGYPAYMQTPAWSKRSLNSALASWTELRHDTILYAKQEYGLNLSSGPSCYVEPVPEFFGRLLTLTRMTRLGLSDMAALSDEAREKLMLLEEMLNRLIEIATKELTNQPLSGQDRWDILNYLVLGELEYIVGAYPDTPKTTLVADVHTCVSERMVLEEAVGKVDLIVVACPQPDGSAFLAAGPVLSYYEFKHPMEDRLTDEKWRELLDSPNKPERPAWYRPLMRDKAGEPPSDIHAKYGGGTGAAHDPYLIYTAEQMNTVGDNPNDWDKHFELMADIDLSGFTYAAALIAPDEDPNDYYSSFQGTSFTGTLDGNGFIVRNLTIRGEGYVGLFGKINRGAEVRDLGVVDGHVVGTRKRIGILVGSNDGTLINCYSSGFVSSDFLGAGGLVGYNSRGNVTHCYSTAEVHSYNYAGGLIGGHFGGHVTDCYSTGTVSGNAQVGGILGFNASSVSQCYSTGVVRGDYQVGGLVGRNYSYGTDDIANGLIENSYSSGSVTGHYEVGGLVGDNDKGNIIYCYSSGEVDGNDYVGGLVGRNWGEVTDSFWDIQTSGQSSSDGGTGLPTAEMQMASTFTDANWDFVDESVNGTEDIWRILEGQDYPRLWWKLIEE